MAVNLSPVGGVAAQFFNNNGVILTGGKIFTYTAGTTTPQATYTSNNGATAHSNPIILDASGRVPSGEIWLTDGLSYKFVIKDATDVLIGTYDNIVGINSNFINYTGEQEIQTATASQTVFTLTTMQYQPGTNSLSVFVDGVNQYGPGAQYAYVETGPATVTFVTGLHVGASVKFTTATINSASYGDAFQISYTPPFTDSVATNVGDKLAQTVSVKDFGAVGDGVTDDTVAIQAALDSGQPIIFPKGTYLSGPLTQSTNFQRFYADGQVTIQKNANGVLFTSTGIYVELVGIQFNGTGFTGDNVQMLASHPRLINCSSLGTPGRALKATGDHVQIIGTCNVYNTLDATVSGYDIEIGVSGTATLYHQLISVYTGQATGGILLIDTGSHVISGGQFGKLAINSGTSPAGVNGGMTANARILGNVNVALSNSTFTGNQFSNQTITFALGTSQHSLDQSNILVGTTIVNSGNANSSIIKSIGTGSPNGIVLQYGSDAFNSTVRYNQDEVYLQNSSLGLPNNKPLRFADTGGTYYSGVSLNSNDDWTFGANNGSNFVSVTSGSGGVFQAVGTTSITQCTTVEFRPVPDGTINLGGASNRWGTVYASTGTINTSDERSKQDVRSLEDTEYAVALKCKSLIKAYRFKDAVAEKGDKARIHFGVLAQEIQSAFSSEGLNADDYGLFCYDEWEAKEAVYGEDGNVVAAAVDAGNRYGIRYDELSMFILGAI
jgi:hypothetical protein